MYRYLFIYVFVYVCIEVWMYLFIHVCNNICMDISLYIYIYIYYMRYVICSHPIYYTSQILDRVVTISRQMEAQHPIWRHRWSTYSLYGKIAECNYFTDEDGKY